MKEVTIQIPEGKNAKWVNGVLTLVDEPKADNRPVTERIKTFDDACDELSRRADAGDDTAAEILCDYESNASNICNKQTLAYMRLSIIVAALNEGWQPKFGKGKTHYYPWFCFYTQKEYDELDGDKKRRCVFRSCDNSTYSYCYFGCINDNFNSSHSFTYVGSRLLFRTSDLAKYAGRQFLEEWANFMFKPRTGDEPLAKIEKTTLNKKK